MNRQGRMSRGLGGRRISWWACAIATVAMGLSAQALAVQLDVLHSFIKPVKDDSRGSYPAAGLVQGADGSFYGTTQAGGVLRIGTIFVLPPGGSVTTLHSFSGDDGKYPMEELTLSPWGIHGATSDGAGQPNRVQGTLFRLDASGSLTTPYRLATPGPLGSPANPMLLASDGRLYGTTARGGYKGGGTLYWLEPDGSAGGRLHNFPYENNKGPSLPMGPLMQATDGALYGTSYLGGEGGGGTVYRVGPGHELKIVHHFRDQWWMERHPVGGVIQAVDGKLYGLTTVYDDSASEPALFRLNLDGSEYELVTVFPVYSQVRDGLVQAADGNFYGLQTSYIKDQFGPRQIYRLTPNGAYSVVYTFVEGGPAGVMPEGRLLSASDGHLYGTTSAGGSLGGGTLYRLRIVP